MTNRFVDNGDGTVTDNETGLMWEKGTGPILTWQQAVDRCQALDLAGHRGWRLPEMKELASIVDYDRHNPACDSVFVVRSVYYWSSTTLQGSPSYAWFVGFCYGFVYLDLKDGSYAVRAVRGGLVGVRE